MNISDYIIYKNNQLIAFNKPAGLAVQADKTGDVSLHQLAEIYCQCNLYLIHRLDRVASGVVLFAKNDRAAAALSKQFQARDTEKTYYAVVEQKPTEEQGELRHFLRKDSQKHKTLIVQENEKDAQESILSYSLSKSSERYHLLQIQLLTGRFHQIRAQLAAIGCPIKGDVKYGARRANPDRSIHLHAANMNFTHPVSNERVELHAPFPLSESLWQYFANEGIEL